MAHNVASYLLISLAGDGVWTLESGRQQNKTIITGVEKS